MGARFRLQLCVSPLEPVSPLPELPRLFLLKEWAVVLLAV